MIVLSRGYFTTCSLLRTDPSLNTMNSKTVIVPFLYGMGRSCLVCTRWAFPHSGRSNTPSKNGKSLMMYLIVSFVRSILLLPSIAHRRQINLLQLIEFVKGLYSVPEINVMFDNMLTRCYYKSLLIAKQ